MVKSTETQDLSLFLAKSVLQPNLSSTTFPLQNVTMHVSFCMHLDILIISRGFQYEQNLITGIRKIIEKPTSNQ